MSIHYTKSIVIFVAGISNYFQPFFDTSQAFILLFSSFGIDIELNIFGLVISILVLLFVLWETMPVWYLRKPGSNGSNEHAVRFRFGYFALAIYFSQTYDLTTDYNYVIRKGWVLISTNNGVATGVVSNQ